MPSSVLETFLILFDSDSANVKKGASDAKKTTDDLNKSLKATDVIGNKIGSGFKDLIKQAGEAAIAFASVGAIIGGIKAAAEYSNQLGELSRGLNLSADDLSNWSDAVRATGGDAGAFQETVKGVTASLTMFAVKGTSRTAPFFKELGIKMVDAQGKARPFLDLLPEIADKFSKISKTESFGIGEKMGLDQGTITLLQQGQREVATLVARQKELGGVTEKDKEVSMAFTEQWKDTAHAFRSLFIAIDTAVLPAFTAVLHIFEKVTTYLRSHSDLVVGALMAIGAAITIFVIPPLISAAAAALLLYAPFLLIGAAVAAVGTAFALIYDDIKNFEAGNKSVIGLILTKWPRVGTVLRDIGKAYNFLAEGANNLVQTIILVGNTIAYSMLHPIAAIKHVIGLVSDLYNKFKAFIGLGDANVTANTNIGKTAIAGAAGSPLASQTSNSIVSSSRASNKSTSVHTGPITIQTKATDAQGIAGAIGHSLHTQVRQAVANSDDGVAA